MPRSSLVVVVRAAEPTVAELRDRYDSMARRGVPAHVTVLAFRPVVDDDTAASVAKLVSGFPAFEFSLARVGRFPEGVVFLAPEPEATFKAMTRLFAEAFPDCAPHGGAFPDPTPHLTVGRQLDNATADLVAAAAGAGLPITAVVERLTLIVENDEGNWTVDRSWPLAAMQS